MELVRRDCPDEETVLAFIQGQLPSGGRETVAQHVARCESCADLAALAVGGLADSARTTGQAPRVWTLDSPPPDQLTPGTEVGRYQILRLIGRGGMGEVYSAYHPDLDRRIAIKIVYGPKAGDLSYQHHLLKEAQLIARLSHPHIVAVHDAGMVGGRVYVAMEFVDGRTLDVWLREREHAWQEILHAFVQAGQGLAAAHEAKVVHRDFKPLNVMVGRDGRIRVMDFGLARPLWEVPDVTQRSLSVLAARPDTVVMGSVVIGTPAYMAPEQLRGEAVDVRADQYSFCVALHEALFGVRPDEANKALRHGRGGPPWVKAIVRRGLEPDREKRFPSMRDLLRAVERGRGRSRRWVLGAVAAGALLAGLITWRAVGGERITCTPPTDRIAAVWPSEETAGSRRATIHHAFLASTLAEPEKVWRRVASILDDHVAQWAAMYKDSCEATHRRGEQSGEVLDLRTACLSENLDEVRAYTDGVLNGGAGNLRRVLPAANDLSPVRQCADVKNLRLQVPLPKDDATRAIVKRLQEQLKDASELLAFGYDNKAEEELRAALSEAHDTHYKPILAQTLQSLGLVKAKRYESEEAKKLSGEAFRLAIASHDDAMAARAAEVIGASDTYLAQYDDASQWLSFGEAMLDRLNARGTLLDAWILNDKGCIYFERGEFASAEAVERSAIMIKEHLGAPPDLASTLGNLALTLDATGRTDQARATARRAVSIYEETGDQESAVFLNDLSTEEGILLDSNQLDEAQAEIARALQIARTNRWNGTPIEALVLTDYGRLLVYRGRQTAAIPILERARSVLFNSDLKSRLVRADVTAALAQALDESGVDRRRARSLALEACQTFEQAGFSWHERRRVLSWFNRVLAREGRPAASCEDLRMADQRSL